MAPFASSFPVAIVVTAVAVALLLALLGGAYARGALQLSHRHREESADALKQVQDRFARLGDQIQALDIDSELAKASPQGKVEYGKALDFYEDAERRLKQSDDPYQREQAVTAINKGLYHCRQADALFNPQRDPKDEVDQLSKLAALHQQGAITDAEFAEQKAKLIQ